MWLYGQPPGSEMVAMAWNMTCSDIINDWHGQDRCDMVSTMKACSQEGLINFNKLAYCTLGGEMEVAIPVLAICAVCLFFFLGLTADSFLCPNMLSISMCLHMPEHIAGVTFLAFANGAPDLFSVFAAISGGPETASMAFGAAFGAGLAVCTVVIGTIIMIEPFRFKRRPFVRDVVTYLAAVGAILATLLDGQVTLFEALSLVTLYVAYVAVVAIGHVVYKSEYWQKNDPLRPKPPLKAVQSEQTSLVYKGGNSYHTIASQISSDYGFDFPDDQTLLGHIPKRQTTTFLVSASPIDLESWETASRPAKAFMVLRAPLLLALKLTTPVITAKDEAAWCRPLFAIQMVLAPISVLFLTKAHGDGFGSVPDWGIALLLGGLLGLFALLCFPRSRPPAIYRWLSLSGFVVSVVWVYVVADTAVDLLATLGILCGVSDALIGLLVMGLGNSVGDLAANVAIARGGFPTMAASACFGAPALNMLIGIGGTYLYIIWTSGESVAFETAADKLQLLVSAYFLLTVLGLMALYILCRNFYADRLLAKLLFAIYAAFLTTAIVFEVHEHL
mmetsp:Transcript_33778/g.88757  ORF Transcript_33778/g.88757 Transcript_33778/m.88757 type:complete len:560 (+) Transcript_33778:178-1857(+)